MADEFLKLSREDQREVIVAAAPELRLLPAVVEKDVGSDYATGRRRI